MRVSDLVRWKAANLEERQTDSMSGVREEMNRLFEEFFRDFRQMQEGSGLSTFNPSTNVSQSADAIEASIELPGLDENDIDVTLGPHSLTIKGEKRTEKEAEEKSYVHRERSYGYFERTIPLPRNAIDRDNVEATFEKGVLHIRIPKKEESTETRRRIEVRSE